MASVAIRRCKFCSKSLDGCRADAEVCRARVCQGKRDREKVARRKAAVADEVAARVESGETDGLVSFDLEHALLERARRMLAETELTKRRGELVERKGIAARWAQETAVFRAEMLGLEVWLRQQMPELTLEQVATIDGEIRRRLCRLADD